MDARDKAWREANHEYVSARSAGYHKAVCEQAGDVYVRKLLRGSGTAVTSELIELKRVQLQIKRYLRG
jgi:hypothetical protein